MAISIFIGSILLSSCNNIIKQDEFRSRNIYSWFKDKLKTDSNKTSNSSNKNEIKFNPASRDEMNLYRQIGISYFCLARQAKVEFPQSISVASNNYALIVSKKHGGFIEETGDQKLTNNQLYQGSYLQLIEGAIQLCPDLVPEEEKKKFSETVEKLNEN